MGGQGGPIICDFAPIHYLLTDKIPIYCLPLQYQFSDYLPDSDKWTIGQLDKCPITKRTALCSQQPLKVAAVNCIYYDAPVVGLKLL